MTFMLGIRMDFNRLVASNSKSLAPVLAADIATPPLDFSSFTVASKVVFCCGSFSGWLPAFLFSVIDVEEVLAPALEVLSVDAEPSLFFPPPFPFPPPEPALVSLVDLVGLDCFAPPRTGQSTLRCCVEPQTQQRSF